MTQSAYSENNIIRREGFLWIPIGIQTLARGNTMGKLLKKLFSSFVALATIAWSVGIGTFAFTSPVHAIGKGRLLKASGPAVYYEAVDGKRYVFPNEKTYFSWFRDFSGVVTISDGALAAIPIGGNVTIRQGTKLVKITTDPKVYAVTLGGQLHWIESEPIATQLYGSSWADRVVDVPDSFFVNYTIGSSISTPVHPDGSLVQYSGSPNIYIVWNGEKRLIASEAAYAANGFASWDVLPTTISYPDGTSVTGREDMISDVIYLPGAGVAGNVNVTLASDTPAGMTLPKNSASVRLVKWNFTAGSAGATISSLTIHRVGVGAASDWSNVYLYQADGTRLTTGRTVNSTTNLVQFNSLGISVPAGTTLSLELWGDLSSPTTTGGEHAFEIEDAASVGVAETNIGITGTFPVRGNTFTVGTSSAARLDVQKGATPTNPAIGSSDVEISNFKLIANTNDIEVRQITLLQAGSVTNTDLTNLKLWQGSTLVASTAALTGDKIVLDFTPPYVLTEGTTRTFRLTADVGGRSSRTIKTYVEYTTDVHAVDLTFNSGAAICIADTAVGGCTSTSQGSFDGDDQGTTATTDDNLILVTTEGGQLTTAFNGPPASNISKGKQDVVLYRFALTSSDSDLEVRNMYFTIAGSAGTDLVKGSLGTEYFRDLKIINEDTGATVVGPFSYPSSVSAGDTTTGVMTFAESFNLPAGTTMNLAFTADLANSEDTSAEFYGDGNNQYRVTMANSSGALFGSSDVRIVDTGEYLATTEIVPNTTINGNYHTVKAASLTVDLASSPSSGTAVKNQSGIDSVGLAFTSGDQSDILVRSVILTGQGSLDNVFWSATTTRAVVTTCALYDSTGAQLGTSESPDVTTGEMNITGVNLTVPAGSSVNATVKCTADSVVEGAQDYFSIGVVADDGTSGASADITAEDAESNSVTASVSAAVDTNAASGTSASVTQTVKSGGVLTLATDNLRQATILVAGGTTWHNLAQFKATAQFEPINLTRVRATTTGDAADFAAIAVAQDGVVLGSATLPAGQHQAKDIDLSTPIAVPMDGSVTFQIWGKLAETRASGTVSGATTGVARSGNTLAAGVDADVQTGNWDSNYSSMYNVRAVGQASGDLVYPSGAAASVGNTFVLRKTKPTVTRQSLSTTTLANGSDMDLFKFQVSADSAGSVAVKKFTFSLARTTSSGSSMSLSNFRLRKGTSDLSLSDVTITDENGNDLEAAALDGSTTATKVVVLLTSEESISGSGPTYTLHANVAGTVAGDAVTTSLYRDPSAAVTTGYLTTSVSGGLPSANLDNGTTPGTGTTSTGDFVWSDNSETPHTSSIGSSSSRDWTNSLYVEDLTSVQTLTR